MEKKLLESLANQLQENYPETIFCISQGKYKNVPDIKLTGGIHPKDYKLSKWNSESAFADFRPSTENSLFTKILKIIRFIKGGYIGVEEQKTFLMFNNALKMLKNKNYEEYLVIVKQIFKHTNFKRISSLDYAFLGLGFWLIGIKEDAIKIWRDGLTSPFVDIPNGIKIPALLFFASVSFSDKALEKEALFLLKQKSENSNATEYPTSLYKFLINEIDESQFIDSIQTNQNMLKRYLCQTYFYIAVIHLKNNDSVGYKRTIEKCISCTGLLEPEYYLAIEQYESSLVSNDTLLN